MRTVASLFILVFLGYNSEALHYRFFHFLVNLQLRPASVLLALKFARVSNGRHTRFIYIVNVYFKKVLFFCETTYKEAKLYGYCDKGNFARLRTCSVNSSFWSGVNVALQPSLAVYVSKKLTAHNYSLWRIPLPYLLFVHISSGKLTFWTTNYNSKS